jgi:uncharacterized membrane protein YoaK (UPF0700 family)
MTEQTGNLILEKRHSGLAIAATVIAFVLPILFFLFLVVGSALFMERRGTQPHKVAVISLVIVFLFAFIHLLCLIFSLKELFSKKVKKLFPVIGSILNAILLLLGVALIVAFISHFPPEFQSRLLKVGATILMST